MGKTVAIVQARMGASRLPGKLLEPLGDRCVLRWVLDRLSLAAGVSEIIVATTTSPKDAILSAQCAEWGIACHRGSEEDVLGRFIETAQACAAETIVRVNADNPLIDPAYLGELVRELHARRADYVSFQRGDGRPVMLTGLGFFAEAMTTACLRRAGEIVTDPFEREHVTLGIYGRPDQFAISWLSVPDFCNDIRLRYTLDTPGDLQLLREIFSALGHRALQATAADVTALLGEHAEWLGRMAELNEGNPKSARNSNG